MVGVKMMEGAKVVGEGVEAAEMTQIRTISQAVVKIQMTKKNSKAMTMMVVVDSSGYDPDFNSNSSFDTIKNNILRGQNL